MTVGDDRAAGALRSRRSFRAIGERIPYSRILLEVTAQNIVKTPVGRCQDEIVLFLATAADRIDEAWHDPAGLGGESTR